MLDLKGLIAEVESLERQADATEQMLGTKEDMIALAIKNTEKLMADLSVMFRDGKEPDHLWLMTHLRLIILALEQQL